MHIYIVGGSGRTGQLVINTALKRGHTVTALVRNPDSLQPRPGLTIAKGTLSEDDITTTFLQPTRPDAVIVTLNAPRASDSPFAAPLAPPRMMADAHAALAGAMRAQGVRKIVTMSAFGVGDSGAQLICPLRAVLRGTNMRFQFADHDLVDAEMRERSAWLDWVLVRPAMLTEGNDAAKVRVWGGQGVGAPWLGKVARGSVAAFLVEAAEGSEWVGRTPVITG